MKRCLIVSILLSSAMLCSAAKTKSRVWTSVDAADLPASFSVQGEYEGSIDGGGKLGAQIIAVHSNAVHAVILPGGLPGAGWDGEHKILMDGTITEDGIAFTACEVPKKYNGKTAREFSATSQFPPAGHKAFPAASISDGTFSGKTDEGKAFRLKKVVRSSPTMGKKAPAGATVLFDGTNTEAFQSGRLDDKTKFLNTDGRDIRTKEKYSNYHMHVEFMLPFRPVARGQGRGNSGFYQVDHYEVQILDSFALMGFNNECGGVYKNAQPSVNMCYPPLTWQSYDIDFTNAVVENGQKVKAATITLRHNGVLIHDKVEIKGPTGGHRKTPEGTPGQIRFQGHGNPVQFRNVWIQAK